MQLPSCIATTNADKHREFEEILGVPLERLDLDLLEPQELDVVAVVRAKAADAYARVGRPVLVEDTGLEVRAWNGLPGALIKWFIGSVGRDGFLRMLVLEKDRRALARTAIGFADASGVHVVVGECAGSIASRVRGENGFGWDPIFIPDAAEQSFAEMTAPQKNAVSHRRRALDALLRLAQGEFPA